MKKFKFLSVCFVICALAAAFAIVPGAFAEDAASGSAVTITQDGSPVTDLTLPQNEKMVLHAETLLSGDIQWQYLADRNTELWVDIYGDTDADFTLSYAKVFNMLNAEGMAQIRCVVGDTASEPVYVTMEEALETAPASAEAAESAKIFNAPAKAAEAFALGDETTSVTYNIVINYVFEDNSPAADPYTANLAAGSNFSATVTFPTVQGYLPYLNEVQQDSIDLNFTGIQQDVTYNVVYKPTNVDYTVIHYQQNSYDDNYTEVDRETKQGLTKSKVPEVEKEYKGFYALLYEKPAIAADGSTIVEVYYDRYYYLMLFDLDGGYGVEPVYARYGANIGDVGTPTKAGYTFKGWSLNNETTNTLPSTMPAENRTYKAVWQVGDTAKVTVVFWGENANDEEYSYIKSSQVEVKPGTEFTYSEDGSLICALEEHTHDLTECYELTCTQEKHTHSESCYTCGETEHTTHTTACYDGVGNKQNVYTGIPNNPVNGQVVDHWRYGKLIYINGSWYRYSGTTTDGNIAPTTCHKHSDDCLGCGKTEHTHSIENGCYTLTCTKTEHSHNSNCYMGGAGLDSALWRFVKSDTVTVAADGSGVVNVYYDRTEKTLTFKYNYRKNNYQSTETITAKWGADISAEYKKIAANAGSTFWAATDSEDGPYTNYFGVMPQTSATYYNRGTTGSEGTMAYLGQDLNGEYTVELFTVGGVGGYYVTDEDRYEFNGFTYDHGTDNGSSCSGAAFYYTRNSYTLTFNDGYNVVKTGSVLYEAPLNTYSDYTPAVPSAYESGSVTFGGWYLNPECTGEKYILSDHTMPADNVLLYAKWVPVVHKVNFYLDEKALEEGTELEGYKELEVPHGSKVESVPPNPTKGDYSFIGWFYKDGNTEKAFDFANMPVNKDLNVYGKWSSNVMKLYRVYYQIEGKTIADNDFFVADLTEGYGLAGSTKTFEAKGGSELYEKYQEGYFPLAKSHSFTLNIEGEDTYIFEYVQRDAVPYKVRYVDAATGEDLLDPKEVSDNRKAVVTETFVPINGMMPDAYQKRLVVNADPSDEEGMRNEIVFEYTKDTTHAYYKITHYTENLAKDAQGNPTWTEYASSQAVGDIGTTYTADAMTIPGFTYNADVKGTVASGELTATGLELKLYYTRNSYPYEVRYLEQGTGKQLHDPEKGTAKYGTILSKSAISIEDYEAVYPTTQSLNIYIEEGNTAKLNVITFYYKEKQVQINYEVIGPDGCGSVSPTGESLKIKSGTPQGSTATANDGYRFVGWFKDAACTQPVDENCVAGNKFTPAKEDDKNVAGTYYAKFERALADLTITKTGAEDIDENQSFIFEVKGDDSDKNTRDISLTVTVQGNGSVTIKDLPVGNYTVKEKTDWSWRYSPKNYNQEVELSAANGKVTFANTRSDIYWLNGCAYKLNKFVTPSQSLN